MRKIDPLSLALASLLVLAALLPIGRYYTIQSPLFDAILILHVIGLLIASALSLLSLVSLITSSKLPLKIISIFALILVILAALPNFILPSTARDALIHHLAIPKIWIIEGKIHPTLWHSWSHYPMLIQLAFTGILKIASEQMCSIYIFLFVPLTAEVISRLAGLFKDQTETKLCAALIALLLPTVIKLSSIALVDLPLLFLCGVGLFYITKLQSESNNLKNILLSGVAWGLALSTKLNAIPAFVIIFIISFLSCQDIRKNLAKTIRAYLLTGLVATIIYSPWMIKSYLWTTNPFYPYMTAVFQDTVPKYDSGLKGLSSIEQRTLLYGESLAEIASLPIRIFIDGEDNNPKKFDGILSPLLLLGLLFGLFQLRQSFPRTLTLYSLIYLFFAIFSMGIRVRYLAPIIPSLSVLCSIFFTSSYFNKNALRFIPQLLLATQLIFSFIYVKSLSDFRSAIAYYKSELSAENYYKSKIPEFPLIQYINQNLPENSKVFLIYTGNQFYLYNRNTYSSGHTSADHLIYWIKNSEDSSIIYKNMKEFKLTHLLVQDQRLSSVLDAELNMEKKAILSDFAKNYLTPLKSEGGFTLYSIK